MIHLVTHYCPRNKYAAEMFRLTSEYNGKVAERLGWNFIADSKRRVPDLSIFREKTALIVEAHERMQDGDIVLRVDGDCLIIGKNTASVFDELGDNDIACSKTKRRWDCAVVAYRVNPVTREMWLLHRDHVHDPTAKPGWDGHVCSNCNIPEWKRGYICGSRKTKMVALHRKWNDRLTPLPDTEILGFHKFDDIFRRTAIARYLKEEGA